MVGSDGSKHRQTERYVLTIEKYLNDVREMIAPSKTAGPMTTIGGSSAILKDEMMDDYGGYFDDASADYRDSSPSLARLASVPSARLSSTSLAAAVNGKDGASVGEPEPESAAAKGGEPPVSGLCGSK